MWLFEAFDAEWFDENAEPETPAEVADVAEYYERAALYLLELHVQPMHLRWFPALESVEKAAAQENDEIEEWFVFEAASSAGRMLGEGELPLTIYSNLYQPGLEAGAKDFRSADSSVQTRLRKAVSTDHIPDASEEDLDNGLTHVAGAHVDWAVVYDVGQGNAVGLCNAMGSVEAYFDFGGGVLRNAGTFPSALTNFCFTHQPPIILSHWDFDHWSSANRDPQCLGMTWIAPRQSVGPTHVALMTQIMSSSGTLLFVPKNLPAKWRGQLHLELCTGPGRNHSGLALTLSAQNDGAGDRMLFPGDARYTCLPSFPFPNNYLSVVAPHHGADMRNRNVPKCPAKPPSRLVYSFGSGNSYLHPHQVTRQDHDGAGWHDPNITTGASQYEVRETVKRIPGPFGHVLLGWRAHTSLPPLPCPGICQLPARQL
jgi:hypothetical protein